MDTKRILRQAVQTELKQGGYSKGYEGLWLEWGIGLLYCSNEIDYYTAIVGGMMDYKALLCWKKKKKKGSRVVWWRLAWRHIYVQRATYALRLSDDCWVISAWLMAALGLDSLMTGSAG